MKTFIVSLILVVIFGSAVLYIRKAKKRGAKCIGCPNGPNCSGHCCGCGGNTDTDHQA